MARKSGQVTVSLPLRPLAARSDVLRAYDVAMIPA